MANRSAEKRERQNVKRRMHNRMIKSSVRTQIKKFDAAVQA
ncbi:30S ribosomal protein S20, partial [Salmonella enterica]